MSKLWYVALDGKRQPGKFGAGTGKRAIALWRMKTKRNVSDARLSATPAESDEAALIMEIRSILNQGESGADLGSAIEQTLVAGRWGPDSAEPRGDTPANRALRAVRRRMYGREQEWDADLGPDIERILDAEGV